MKGALWILGVTLIVGIALWISDRFYFRKKFPQPMPEERADADSDECCGMHDVCEKTSLAIIDTDYQYYDDEELDVYKGRRADDYNDKEIEEFRDVLLTLREDDVAGWAKSISLRGIEMPCEVKEEMLLIIGEQRLKASSSAKS